MPTPICPRIFNKIEEMNPLMFGEWKEETATPKFVVYSKNFNRPHIIHLMALIDINKNEDTGKYGQKEPLPMD